MEIKSPELKKIIYNIIAFTDEVNAKKESVSRTTFKKEYARGALSLKDKIFNAIELGLIDSSKDKIDSADEIEWHLVKDYKPVDGKKPWAERHTEVSMDIDDKELKALKYYYNERDELPAASSDSLDELEKLLQ